MAGFKAGTKLDKLGCRGSNTYPLFFDDCIVPGDNVLGSEGRGVEVLMSGLDYERTVMAAGPLGIMAGCMDVVLPYIHERKQFGRSIGEFQLMQGKLADMYSTWQACRAYRWAGYATRGSTPAASGRMLPARSCIWRKKRPGWPARPSRPWVATDT